MTLSTTAFDSTELTHRVAGLRSLGLAFALILTAITTGICFVVYFSLDGVPLAGNLYRVAGIPLPTIVAGVIVLATPVVAMLVGRSQGRSALRQIAAAHPELAGSSDEADRLIDAFATAVHAELALTMVVGFGCAVLFHVTTDPLLLVAVGLIVLLLIVRRPGLDRARAWLADAAESVRRLRTQRQL